MGRASRTAMTLTTSFRNLEVWQESMMLVEEIYALSRAFPRDELFGLTAQLHKAAISIPSNIGEGARRKKLRVTLNHYDIALGSQGEVEVQLEIAKRLGYCTDSDYGRLQERVERVGRMLNGLIASIQPDGPWTWCLATLGLL
jgi:four helix bundle protein